MFKRINNLEVYVPSDAKEYRFHLYILGGNNTWEFVCNRDHLKQLDATKLNFSRQGFRTMIINHLTSEILTLPPN